MKGFRKIILSGKAYVERTGDSALSEEEKQLDTVVEIVRLAAQILLRLSLIHI